MFTSDPGAMRTLSRLTGLGLMLGGYVALGALAGYYLDRWLKTEPWGLIIGMLLGIAAGFFELITLALRAEREETQTRDGRDDTEHGAG
jgi:ATP synthase protein I